MNNNHHNKQSKKNHNDTQPQEQQYQHIAALAAPLLHSEVLSTAEANALREALTDTDISAQLTLLCDQKAQPEQQTQAKQQLLRQLLDRHGTGRILFRNSRANIKGFPKRIANLTPLTLPEQYSNALKVHFSLNPQLSLTEKVSAQLFPEQVLQQLDASSNWWQFDPRVDYLLQLLKAHKQDKFLLICASAQTAIALEEALRQREGIRAAVFHEGMSIIERDKAAAYFAQEDHSAQLLLCSEIGSEGRNFQFAHHLVLFDLPLNPDLLEQRIGRLDRIGQRADIQLHLPHFTNHAQQMLLDWYQHGLDALEHTCQTGRSVFEQFAPRLLPLLASAEPDSSAMAQLIDDTRAVNQQLKQQLEQGRLQSFLLDGKTYYHRPQLVLTNKLPPKVPNKVWLLSPFDNLVIQRDRLKQLFNFDYQIEVYVPAAKRQIGYYSLPVLYKDQFIGQVDVKADRANKCLLLQHLVLDEQVKLTDALKAALTKAVLDYASFNGCETWQLVKTSARTRDWLVS